MARLLPALPLLYGLFIAAITAITRISACQTRIIAFTVLLLTVGLLAVAALEMPACIVQLLLAGRGRRDLWLKCERVALESGFDGGLALGHVALCVQAALTLA